MSRVGRHDLAGDQPIEEHPDGGQMLFDGRLGMVLHQQLDIRRHVHRLNLVERERPTLAPGRELRHGDEVRPTSIPITDVDGEEFPKTLPTVVDALKEGW